MPDEHQTYICPMHPEVVSDKPGRCPICGMDLVLKNDVKPMVHKMEDKGLGVITWKNYLPLMAIISVILLAAVTLTFKDIGNGTALPERSISYFMIGFFLVFATFKLMDVKGFAHGYQTYDLLASRVPWYGYVYPFLELAFGLGMILMPFSHGLLIAEVVVMLFSGVGVAIKIAKKEEFICACLGTFLKIPLTKVTLVEDFGMAALGIGMLLLS